MQYQWTISSSRLRWAVITFEGFTFHFHCLQPSLFFLHQAQCWLLSWMLPSWALQAFEFGTSVDIIMRTLCFLTISSGSLELSLSHFSCPMCTLYIYKGCVPCNDYVYAPNSVMYTVEIKQIFKVCFVHYLKINLLSTMKSLKIDQIVVLPQRITVCPEEVR